PEGESEQDHQPNQALFHGHKLGRSRGNVQCSLAVVGRGENQAIARAKSPATMAAAQTRRRGLWASRRRRAPRKAPMRMLISRAGASWLTGVKVMAVSRRT